MSTVNTPHDEYLVLIWKIGVKLETPALTEEKETIFETRECKNSYN